MIIRQNNYNKRTAFTTRFHNHVRYVPPCVIRFRGIRIIAELGANVHRERMSRGLYVPHCTALIISHIYTASPWIKLRTLCFGIFTCTRTRARRGTAPPFFAIPDISLDVHIIWRFSLSYRLRMPLPWYRGPSQMREYANSQLNKEKCNRPLFYGRVASARSTWSAFEYPNMVL